MLAHVYLSLTILSIICAAVYTKFGITRDQSANNPTFLKFQRGYIPIYLLAVLGDWLQGPYLYRLYHYHGYVERQVAVIYICGLVSSALFFPCKDYLSDKLGRRKTVQLFSLLYACSSMMSISGNYVVLIVGRGLAGMSNSLLFSSLEMWYVHEHTETHDFPKEWIKVTFSHISFGSGIIAVVAGVTADLFARWLHFGPVSPFLLAVPFFLTVPCLVGATWNENKGPDKELKIENIQKSCSQGLREITTNVNVFLIGAVESVFETCLFIFVFVWTPAVGGFATNNASGQGLRMSDIPLGIAFASFMVCYMIGGLICDYLTHKVNYPLPNLLLPVTGASTGIFLLAAVLTRGNPSPFLRSLVLICLQLIELGCGFYFPIMRVLREKILPSDHQVSIINWFRVPLTLISAVALFSFHTSSGGIPSIFIFCAVLMSVGFLCSIRFVRSKKPPSLEIIENV